MKKKLYQIRINKVYSDRFDFENKLINKKTSQLNCYKILVN